MDYTTEQQESIQVHTANTEVRTTPSMAPSRGLRAPSPLPAVSRAHAVDQLLVHAAPATETWWLMDAAIMSAGSRAESLARGRERADAYGRVAHARRVRNN